MPLIAAMSTALPDECSETLPDAVRYAVTAAQRADRRLQAAEAQELERGEHAAVDDAGADVAAAAAVDVDARVREDGALQRLLAHHQDLPDGRVRASGPKKGFLPAAR